MVSQAVLPSTLTQQLQAIFGSENVLLDEAERLAYGYDNSRQFALPDAVVFATNTQEIHSFIQLCNKENIPIVPRGRGTGTTGATVPNKHGIVISLERMNKIIQVDAPNRVAIVQPGVTNQELQNAVGEQGFFWPPDPTSAAFCSIGGNLAYNSAGPRAVKYGTPRENTLGLRAITGAGKEIKTGTYTTKGVVGYDLTRLIIGSEGTLAVITEATLKLTPLPATKMTMQAVYADIHSAALAVSAIMAQAITPSALEFIDHAAIDMVRDYADADLPKNAGAMLMIEIDGSLAGVADAASSIQHAATNQGLISFIEAKTEDEINALWKIRKALSPALRNVAPKKINEDVVVPVSEIPALIEKLENLSAQYQIKIVNFGHAGNGNIHVNLLVNPDDPQELSRAYQCLDKVFDCVISLNGSLSGEHGVGIEKRDFVDREIDPNSLQLMHAIKKVFDPNNILNPDKTLPLV